MTRNGKIARLPQPIREQINRRLQKGEQGKQILAWLNTLPQAKALLAAEFAGQPFNKVNLSKWKLGGYLDWETHQESLEAVRRFGANATELDQASGGQLAAKLAVYLAARIAGELQKPPSDKDSKKTLERLCQLCAKIAALHRADQGDQWLRYEGEKLEIGRKKLALEVKKHREQSDARKKAAKGANKDVGNQPITRETWDRIEKELKLL